MFTFPLLLTLYAGFTHAFETDHLLAVGNIVSQRNNTRLSMKDGIFWGLGHASTIFFIGILMILFKAGIPPGYFRYFEATVGMMLIALAISRLVKFFRGMKIVVHAHAHEHSGGEGLPEERGHSHLHVHVGGEKGHSHRHSVAYGVGLVHGLAGSGALILVVMAQIRGPMDGLLYLVLFGAGCMVGMSLAAGLFSIPFSKRILQARALQSILIVLSAVVCLLYGGKVIVENLWI